MHYATHAIAPLLAIASLDKPMTRATRVHCFGSGEMRAELHTPYSNPYPVETAIFQLEPSSLAAEVTRSLFHTARAYSESFNVYAENATFEWQQVESDEPVVFRMAPLRPGRGRLVSAERVVAPDRQDLLPAEIRRFTQRGVYNEANPHQSFLQVCKVEGTVGPIRTSSMNSSAASWDDAHRPLTQSPPPTGRPRAFVLTHPPWPVALRRSFRISTDRLVDTHCV